MSQKQNADGSNKQKKQKQQTAILRKQLIGTVGNIAA